jgi:hypothetical protein
LYIAQSPADFVTQFLGNAGGRGPIITSPLAALRLEVSHRYMDSYGLAAWSSATGRLNAIPLVMFLAGAVTCLLVPEIRQHRGYRLLLIWTAIVVAFLTELEGLKTHFYLIYLTPLYSILLAVAVRCMWLRRPRARWALSAAMLVFVALQALRTPSSAWRNRRQLTYDPAVQYLRGQFDRNTLIMGGGGLIFGLGPDWNLLDDNHLGFNSGKRAEVVVVDPAWDDGIHEMQRTSPPIHEFVSHLLKTDYQEVYNRDGYRILVRHPRRQRKS